MDDNIKEINGPVNVVRLEGDVNGIKKVIYLFMDFHADVMFQTSCENIFAKDIQLYLAESFRDLNKTNKMYDFFLETWWMETQNVKYGYSREVDINPKEKYIEEVMKFFRKVFQYDPNENKVSVSKYLKNVRLHYIDIRDYFTTNTFDRIHWILHAANTMWINTYVNTHLLTQIISAIDKIREDCLKIINILESAIKSYNKTGKITIIKHRNASQMNDTAQMNESSQISPEQQQINEDRMEYLLHKTFLNYKNPNIQKKIIKQVEILTNNLKHIASECEIINENFNKIISTIPSPIVLVEDKKRLFEFNYGLSSITHRKILTFIFSEINTLEEKYTHFFMLFMDTYFLRRFLDKDYITNAIVYTGGAHSVYYIENLVKEFNFRVTDFSYSKIPDLKELNAEILKRNDINLGELFFPPLFDQCSNVTHFPENFL